MAVHAVGHVRPAFQENAAAAILLQSGMPQHLVRRCAFVDNIESAFQADEVLPGRAILSRQLHQRFGALTGAAHQFLPRRRRVADSALDLHADDFELSIGREDARKCCKRFGDGVELGAALAADSEDDFVHAAEYRLRRL